MICPDHSERLSDEQRRTNRERSSHQGTEVVRHREVLSQSQLVFLPCLTTHNVRYTWPQVDREDL